MTGQRCTHWREEIPIDPRRHRDQPYSVTCARRDVCWSCSVVTPGGPATTKTLVIEVVRMLCYHGNGDGIRFEQPCEATGAQDRIVGTGRRKIQSASLASAPTLAAYDGHVAARGYKLTTDSLMAKQLWWGGLLCRSGFPALPWVALPLHSPCIVTL